MFLRHLSQESIALVIKFVYGESLAFFVKITHCRPH